MKFSWSQKLFFRLNGASGRRPNLDRFMWYAAHWLIYLMIAALIVWAWRSLVETPADFGIFFLVTLGSYGIAYAASYSIAILVPHRRPIKEFPKRTRLLFQTFGTWKSFPSDHEIAAAIPTMLAVQFGAPLSLVAAFCFGMVLVGVARVYAGVHYPRDIVGGAAVGAASAILAYSIVLR